MLTTLIEITDADIEGFWPEMTSDWQREAIRSEFAKLIARRRQSLAGIKVERQRADRNWNVADYFSGLLDQHGIEYEWPTEPIPTPFVCAAKGSVGANDPQDCGYPDCGCDPATGKGDGA